jgi:hypothetical protein
MLRESQETAYYVSKAIDLAVYTYLGFKALSGLTSDLLWELPHPGFPVGSHIIEQTVPAAIIAPIYYFAKRMLEKKLFPDFFVAWNAQHPKR